MVCGGVLGLCVSNGNVDEVGSIEDGGGVGETQD